ncbi:MAG: hypothetical protein KIS73_27990 [Enhydrobacter sp.]|nr:hypothetical protein [Enhydrobacter sp.]
MYRIDTANNVAALPAKQPAAEDPGYFNNNPGAGSGTVVSGDWLNAVQEELAAVIGGASMALDRNNNAQLLAAIQALVAGVMPTGSRIGFTGQTAPAGWVMGSGRTIGDGASNATERANADTQALFTLLWNDYADAELPVTTSGGGASTRGASAAADFAAHKRMTLPDYRGRAGVGKGDMGGADAARITAAGTGVDGTVLGKTGGAQTHTLTVDEMPAHHHGGGAEESGTNSDSVGGPVLGMASVDTDDTGGGDPHDNMPPFIVELTIIKL